MTATLPPDLPPSASAPDSDPEPAARSGLPARALWRPAGIGFTSLVLPGGLWLADPLLGQVSVAVELAVALVVLGTALFGSEILSDRAFRLLRWIANRPEPPAPPAGSPPGGYLYRGKDHGAPR